MVSIHRSSFGAIGVRSYSGCAIHNSTRRRLILWAITILNYLHLTTWYLSYTMCSWHAITDFERMTEVGSSASGLRPALYTSSGNFRKECKHRGFIRVGAIFCLDRRMYHSEANNPAICNHESNTELLARWTRDLEWRFIHTVPVRE